MKVDRVAVGGRVQAHRQADQPERQIPGPHRTRHDRHLLHNPLLQLTAPTRATPPDPLRARTRVCRTGHEPEKPRAVLQVRPRRLGCGRGRTGDRPALAVWSCGAWRFAPVKARQDHADGRTVYQVAIDLDGSTSVLSRPAATWASTCNRPTRRRQRTRARSRRPWARWPHCSPSSSRATPAQPPTATAGTWKAGRLGRCPSCRTFSTSGSFTCLPTAGARIPSLNCDDLETTCL